MSGYPHVVLEWDELQEFERESWRRIVNRLDANVLPLRDVIKERVRIALEVFDGDKKKAATALGVSLKTIYNYCYRYGWVRYEMPPAHLLATDTDDPLR